MDCPVSPLYPPALADFRGSNQQRILQYLTRLATRQYTPTTFAAVVRTLNAFRRRGAGVRQRVLTADLTQTTAQDIVAFG